MTIVQSTTRYFKGFQVTMTTQVGCATTHDYPSEETTRSCKEYHKRELAKVEALVVPAFEHYVHGDHPFRRFLKYLQSDRELKQENGWVMEKEGTWWMTDQVCLQNLEVHLYVKPDVPGHVKTKICYDFMLAQTTRKDSDLWKPYVDETSKNFFESDLGASVAGYFGQFQWRMEFIIGYIMNHRDELAKIASSQHVEKPDWGYDWNNKQRLRHFRARAIERILDGKPYGKELIEEAKTMPNYQFELFFLLVMASEAQAPELNDILALYDPEMRKHYGALV